MSDKKYDAVTRKGFPLWAGCMMYFPDALLAVAEHSRKANDKHNPGQPLHWSKHKSTDHADCAARHLQDMGADWDAIDAEFNTYHITAAAWRTLAALQTVIDAKRAGLTVRAYIAKLKADAEAAEMEAKRRNPVHYSMCADPTGGHLDCKVR